MTIDAKMLNKIKKAYEKGKTYKEIEKKYNVTSNQITYLIRSNQWKRKSNRSEVQKGNKNAAGNRGGKAPKKNKNAVTTGEFETIYKDVLDDDEVELYGKYKVEDEKETLIEQIKILTIRENRMLKRIKELKDSGKDLTIQNITRSKSSTTEYGGFASESSNTLAESTVDKIQRIEEALTRVQDSKRKCLEALHRFKLEDNRFELELIRMERQAAADEPQESGDSTSDNLIDALNTKAKEVWSDDIN